ncbi:hypothetical protein [Nitrosococcus wardiae]|uniref:Holin n=1 Tax=Nitrosococcus wardiae TaxID=1814290 RepID=A0A4P7C0B5_9GAMM|nr:hypothetical protein [Nitrosococcus wardiae]QBQ54950.1 hypothetical protein E3U44_10800 [Nitrosococcus wardiae]
MQQSKAWYQSRGVWGGVVTIAAAAAGAVGVVISPEQQDLIVNSVVAIATGVGGLLSLYGRLKADKPIQGAK